MVRSTIHRFGSTTNFPASLRRTISRLTCRQTRLHERTVGKLLRKLSFRRLSVRPQHPQTKPEEQAVFRAALPIS
jgi:hypothetical protein